METRPLSDAQLVVRCRAGDQDAWYELVERFSPYVYSITSRAYRLAPADAEDVFQDVFERAYARLDQLRQDDAVRPWIAQLTRRLCLDRLRDQKRTEPAADEAFAGEVDEELERVDEAFAVRQELTLLPEHCQEILDRFFSRDESYHTIAEALDLPSGTIASRISRCLAKLRERLEGRIAAPVGSSEREMR